MATQTGIPVSQRGNLDITWRGDFSIEQREAMIREAAYYHYEQRGYTLGHDLDDWLAAEAELERDAPEQQPLASSEFPLGSEVQQSSLHGAGEDEALKRSVKQHPHKAIPQVESIEPREAPLKE